MKSITQTLVDPFEVAPGRVTGATGVVATASARLLSPDEVTEWFKQLGGIEQIAFLREVRQPMPWIPDPRDRRWRARGWTDEVLD
jgi:hypothetical protein